MVLRCSPALEQRLVMLQRLEATLSMRTELRLALALYKRREDLLTRVYRAALKRGDVREYNAHGMRFEFALISRREVPKDLGLEDHLAFSHCLYRGLDALLFGKRYALAKGSWLLFVVQDMFPDIPEAYLSYAAVHERGEQVTLGDHNLASKLEFAIAAKERNLTAYMAWVEEWYPAKFADIFSYQTHLALPDEDEFQEVLSAFLESDESALVRSLIESFEWPTSLLRTLETYRQRNEQVIEILDRMFRTAEVFAAERTFTLPVIVKRMRETLERDLRSIIDAGHLPYCSFSRLQERYEALRYQLANVFAETRMHRQQVLPQLRFTDEIVEAGIESGLPEGSVFVSNFRNALRAVEEERTSTP
jgi:hypothetical protein